MREAVIKRPGHFLLLVRSHVHMFGVLMVVLGLAIIPLLTPSYAILSLFDLSLIYCCLTLSWNLIAGYVGQFSLATAGFFGLGGYSLAVLATDLKVSPVLSIALAGIIAAFLALGTGVLLLRLREEFFSIATLGLAVTLRVILSSWDARLGATTRNVPSARAFSGATKYYIILICTLVVILAVYKISKSRLGMGLVAVRDDELSAECIGVPSFYYKLISFAISAFFAGVAGGLYVFHKTWVYSHHILGLSWTILPIILCVVGGLGTILWPTIMSFAYAFMFEGVLARFPTLNMIVYGSALIVVTVVLPKGLADLSISKLERSYKHLLRVIGKVKGRSVAGN